MSNSIMLGSKINKPRPEALSQIIVVLVSGLILFLASAIVFWLGYQFYYSGKIYPGVSVAGVDLSGIRIQEANSYLAEHFHYPENGTIVFVDDDQTWEFQPNELGLVLDDISSIEMAYGTGRMGWPWTRAFEQFSAWRQGIHISPKMVYDENIASQQLTLIANQVNQATVEAKLMLEGLEIISYPGQIGRLLDVEETILNLKDNFENNLDGNIDLVMIEQQPNILETSQEAALINDILSQSLTLSLPSEEGSTLGPWVLDQATLATMLMIQRVPYEDGETYAIKLSENSLRDFLSPLAPSLRRTAQNAKFIFNDDTLLLDLIENASIGRDLLIEESILKINQEILNLDHQVELVFDYSNPDITDEMTGEELGITELVSVNTSYFYGSSASRIQNIQTAASQFHGLMVPPGATFSMVENIGDISLDSGYAEALIIYGDRTVKGVGGGVCQVSTTLFRTVFFGGFPVEERYSHAYRVSYYELNASGSVNKNLAGLDATVYAPLIDFKFTNDTPYWMLLETYVYPGARSLTWKFYSTSDGRTVEWDTTGLQNIVKPPNPIYEENDELSKGEIDQVDWGIDGANVTVTRTVWRDGEVHLSDEFKTNYRPWTTVCEYGPDTENYPPDEDNQDKYSCKVVD